MTETTDASRQAALGLAANGVGVSFVEPRTKRPYKGTRGVPAGTSATATTDEAALLAFLDRHPDAVPAACGGSRIKDGRYLSIIDIDPEGKDKQTPEQNCAASDRIAAEIEAKFPGVTKFDGRDSRSGGRHIYILSDAPLRTRKKGVIHPEAELRGAGNYVVFWPGMRKIPGSPDAQVSQSFIELVGAPSEKQGKAAGRVPDAAPETVAAARQWLASQAPAIEGEGGDQRTYVIACGLYDRGVSQRQAVELLAGEWNSRCSPPWDVRDLETKCRSAFQYAQNPPGTKGVLESDRPAPSVDEPKKPRAVIMWDAALEHEIRPEVERVLYADDGPGQVLTRGRELVYVGYVEQAHVLRNENTKPVLLPLAVPFTHAALRERIMQSIAFQTRSSRQSRSARQAPVVTVRSIGCPDSLAKLLLEVLPSAPPLAAIVDTPVLRLDGTILQREGYDPTTRMFGAFKGREFLPVPEVITPEMAREAYRVLVEKLFEDVAFKTPEDAAVKVAALLTLIQNPMLDEAPAFYTSAADGGTGKTTSDEIAAFIATGSRLPATSWPGDDEYQASTMLHDLARQGARCVFFDNLPDGAEVRGATLERIITARAIQRRTVGKADTVAHDFDAVILVNGNALQFPTEGIARRFLHCALDARVANPAERQFQRKDLSIWLTKNRPQMLRAALTMIRGARLARREPSYTLGFPRWAQYVITALEFAGAPPIKGKLVRDDVPNTAGEALKRFLNLWLAVLGKYPLSARELIHRTGEGGNDPERAKLHTELSELLSDLTGKPWHAVAPMHVGLALHKIRNRTLDGLRLTSAPDRNGVDQWVVAPLALSQKAMTAADLW